MSEVLGQKFPKRRKLGLCYLFDNQKVIVGSHERSAGFASSGQPAVGSRNGSNKQLNGYTILPAKYLKLVGIKHSNAETSSALPFNLAHQIKFPLLTLNQTDQLLQFLILIQRRLVIHILVQLYSQLIHKVIGTLDALPMLFAVEGRHDQTLRPAAVARNEVEVPLLEF